MNKKVSNLYAVDRITKIGTDTLQAVSNNFRWAAYIFDVAHYSTMRFFNLQSLNW